MKSAVYKLSGEMAQERGIKGLEIKTREAENMQEILTLVKDGKEEHVLNAAQGAIDIVVQRMIRNAAEDDVTLAILAGKTVKEDEDADFAGDYSGHSDEERKDAVQTRLQQVADTYLYGSRGPSSGGSKVVKEKAAKVDAVAAAAAAGNLSPETIEELKKLGFNL